jgi:hypothetical protein
MTELVVPVVFDDIVLAVDLEHLPGTAAVALRDMRAQVEREGGISDTRLAACHSEGRDRTDLPGCVKTYVPRPTGPWGIVFRAGEDPDGPFALYTIAYGRRHPTGPGQLSVYEIAHRRLNA